MNSKTLKYFIAFLVIFFIDSQLFAFQKGIPQEIAKSIRLGNSEMLSSFFGNVITLNILGSNNYYSKRQAKEIISNFFESNIPESFTIISQREGNNSTYIVGHYNSNNRVYRISYQMFAYNNLLQINRFEIEKI